MTYRKPNKNGPDGVGTPIAVIDDSKIIHGIRVQDHQGNDAVSWTTIFDKAHRVFVTRNFHSGKVSSQVRRPYWTVKPIDWDHDEGIWCLRAA